MGIMYKETEVKMEPGHIKIYSEDPLKCYTFTDLDGNWFQLVNPNDH